MIDFFQNARIAKMDEEKVMKLPTFFRLHQRLTKATHRHHSCRLIVTLSQHLLSRHIYYIPLCNESVAKVTRCHSSAFCDVWPTRLISSWVIIFTVPFFHSCCYFFCEPSVRGWLAQFLILFVLKNVCGRAQR